MDIANRKSFSLIRAWRGAVESISERLTASKTGGALIEKTDILENCIATIQAEYAFSFLFKGWMGFQRGLLDVSPEDSYEHIRKNMETLSTSAHADELRKLWIRHLAVLDSEQALPLLRQCIETHHDQPNLLDEALLSLSFFPDAPVEDVERLLDHESSRVRRRALETLHDIDEEVAIGYAASRLEEPDKDVQLAAVGIMGSSTSDIVVSDLLDLYFRADDELRDYIRDALRSIYRRIVD